MRFLNNKDAWHAGKPAITLFTLFTGAGGGALLNLLGMPAGWLCGAMLAVAAVSLGGLPTRVPHALRDATFIVLGTSMGSSITPDTLHDILLWPVSIAILLCSVAASMFIGAQYLRRRHGWDRATAQLSAVPGALSAVLALASGTTANLPTVALSQTLRQFVLVSLVPLVLMFGSGEKLKPVVMPAATLIDAAIMLMCGAAGSILLARLRVPGAMLVGAMLVSALLHAAGWVNGRLDPMLLTAAFVCTGAAIGSRFAGTRIELLLATIRPALGSIFVAIAIAAVFAALCRIVLDLPFAEIWLAYAPGGVEVMTIMAFALNLDPSYVSTHHVIRLLLLMLASPLWTYGLTDKGRI
ncbi:AbrB family transcriptional regulator [Uliginosibacterium sp. sgz301328]|uniref:AbrB family transcriptional regulator n=1 Tax=Uliginosibacterium sp. sgz301328 TaxID=3243764 RepID=UPI00359D05F9